MLSILQKLIRKGKDDFQDRRVIETALEYERERAIKKNN